MKLSALLDCAAAVGIKVTPDFGTDLAESDLAESDLYAWVVPQTTPEDAGIIYIGKHITNDRVKNELGWAGEAEGGFGYQSGFGPTMATHGAKPVRLVRRKTNITKALEALEKAQWLTPKEATELRRRLELESSSEAKERGLTVQEIETVLIQIVVRSGCLLANSSDAGLWSHKPGRWQATLAGCAVARYQNRGM